MFISYMFWHCRRRNSSSQVEQSKQKRAKVTFNQGLHVCLGLSGADSGATATCVARRGRYRRSSGASATCFTSTELFLSIQAKIKPSALIRCTVIERRGDRGARVPSI